MCRQYQDERGDEDTTEVVKILYNVIMRVFKLMTRVHETRESVQFNKKQPYYSS